MTTTAPPPEAEALATAPKAIVISQFDVLLADIAEAKTKAADVSFNYADPKGNKEARSYVYAIRKLNARIESARTDAKAYALAYGRKVDSQAAELKDQVAALIKPHQDAIDAITQAEADRVQRHRAVIHFIRDLGRVPFGACAETLAASLESAKAADIDGLEEFKEEAAAALLETIRTLEAAHAKALADEAAAAELAQLREQQRIQQEKEAADARIRARQEAIAEAARKEQGIQQEKDADANPASLKTYREAMSLAARMEQHEADAAALLAIEPADVQVAMPPEIAITYQPRRYRSLGAGLPRDEVEGLKEDAALALKAVAGAEHKLRCELRSSLAGRTRPEVVDALVTGTLHPAVTIDWSKV
jgi:colicin import membrane protein